MAKSEQYSKVLQQLKKQKYHPVYIFHGEEPYYIDRLTQYIQDNVLADAEKDFNQSVFYGRDASIERVINTAQRYPMMGQRQVVILREAQNIKNLEKLQHYIQKPQGTTLLVVSHKGALDARSRFYKAIKDKAVIFKSEKVRDYQMTDWIQQYAREQNISMNAKVANILSEYLGSDLHRVTHELNKLLLVIPKGQNEITTDDVEKNIGISKEYNPFELNKALAEKDVVKANRIIRFFGKNPNEYGMPMIIGTLYSFFSRLLGYHFLDDQTRKDNYKAGGAIKANPKMMWLYEKAARKYNYQKTVRIIGYLRDYDMRSKGLNNVSAAEADLLKEMVYKILH